MKHEIILDKNSHGVSRNKIRGYNVEEHYVSAEFDDEEKEVKLVGHSCGNCTCDCVDSMYADAENIEEAKDVAQTMLDGLNMLTFEEECNYDEDA